MKAITFQAYGGAEVLNLQEVETPTPQDDEVLIRVRAAEATKADCEMRSFKFPVNWFWLPLRIALGICRPRREILGSYFAGEIAETASAVTRFKVGDEIFGTSNLRLGAYAEYLSLPERSAIALKPVNMTFPEAAAVPLGGMNALHFIKLAKLEPGSRILINGAGGSIGAYAIQIAKAFGAHVTAVDKDLKAGFVNDMGADVFIDYEKENFLLSEQRYDAIFDMVPGSDYSGCVNLLKPGGRYLLGNARLSSLIRSISTTRATDKKVRVQLASETVEALEELKALIESGRLGPILDRTLPMSEARRAHELVESEARTGAIVIEMI